MQRSFALILLGSFLLLAQPPVSDGADPMSLGRLCQLASLPADIQAALSRRFPGWKIVEPGDLTQDMLARWSADTPGTCPGIVSGHLEKRSVTNYLLLLSGADQQSYGLVAFREEAPGLYGLKLLEQAQSGAGVRFLRLVSPAKKYADHVRSSGDAVLLVTAAGDGIGAMLYFWDEADYDHRAVPYP
jgi:hypothetical protein